LRVLTVGAMYPPHYSGGYELVWRAFARHMNERGHDLGVLCSDVRVAGVDASAQEDPWVARELSAHVHGRQPPLGRRGLFARERHNARAFDRAVAELAPDAVMWWHMLGVSLGLMERARRAGLRSLAVVHDEWPLYGPGHDAWLETWRAHMLGPLVGRLTGLPARADPMAVDGVSFNSDWLRDRVLGTLDRQPAARVSVIPPGIPDGLFHRAPARQWDGRLACVGRIDERKGLGVAVEAVALLGGSATLTIAGGGDDAYLADLRERADERVRFEPPAPREELQRVYESADAILFPVTWHEPWGLVPLEAMAVGRPVVATGTGGSGEYLVDGENALLVPPGDARALAAAVERLREDPGLRERLVANGLRTAAEHSERASLAAMEREIEAIAG
jgi:glycogen(starch) synthase